MGPQLPEPVWVRCVRMPPAGRPSCGYIGSKHAAAARHPSPASAPCLGWTPTLIPPSPRALHASSPCCPRPHPRTRHAAGSLSARCWPWRTSTRSSCAAHAPPLSALPPSPLPTRWQVRAHAPGRHCVPAAVRRADADVGQVFASAMSGPWLPLHPRPCRHLAEPAALHLHPDLGARGLCRPGDCLGAGGAGVCGNRARPTLRLGAQGAPAPG